MATDVARNLAELGICDLDRATSGVDAQAGDF